MLTPEKVLQTITDNGFRLPYPPHSYQLDTVCRSVALQATLLNDKVGCVDSETEFLSRTGWKKISEYTKGDEVTQINNLVDLNPELVTPERFIKEPCDEMVRIKTKYGVDQMLSREHEMIIASASSSTITKCQVLEAGTVYNNITNWMEGENILARATKNVSVSLYSVPCCFNQNNSSSFIISDERLRLMAAVIADGYFPPREGDPTCLVRVKKERKKVRLRQLLKEANISWIEKSKDYPTAVGYTVFTFYPGYRRKHFSMSWVSLLSKHQLEVLADEVIRWDGNVKGKRRSFSSRVKESADFVQYVFSVDL